MNLKPGDALAVKINSHKHQWNGEVCSNPVQWRCGAEERFRESQCERGAERCFHLKIFSANGPRLVIPDPSVVKFLAEDQSFLDDQILFFYGQNFDLRAGRSGTNDHSLYGVYRVKRAYIESGFVGKSTLIVEPYPDGWAVFPRNRVRKPPTTPVIDGASYLVRVSERHMIEALGVACEATEDGPLSGNFTQGYVQRLHQFSDGLLEWKKAAARKLEAHDVHGSSGREHHEGGVDSALASRLKELLKGKAFPASPNPGDKSVSDDISSPSDFTESAGAAVTETDSISETVSPVRPDTPLACPSEEWMRQALPDESCRSDLLAAYGERLVTALQLGSLSKSLLILTGAPGVGKSWLASKLIDDKARERSEIVPVSSTWRGREDLLGYVNPVTGEFEPTSFTCFLRRCESAWDAGDRRTWLVVFEEFNLSQPEHWLSDLLVRLEFAPQSRADRTITLGGAKVAGECGEKPPEIFLAPSLMFVATLNNDHTVRPLSPRVLDRAALVEVSATGRAALKRIGLSLADDAEEAIEELNDLLEPRGVAFSVRSARSLRLANLYRGDEHVMSNLDHVLAQEVLSQVRLMVGDPRDEALLSRLKEWSERPASVDLMLCRERLSVWEDSLMAGRDVFQA